MKQTNRMFFEKTVKHRIKKENMEDYLDNLWFFFSKRKIWKTTLIICDSFSRIASDVYQSALKMSKAVQTCTRQVILYTVAGTQVKLSKRKQFFSGTMSQCQQLVNSCCFILQTSIEEQNVCTTSVKIMKYVLAT